MELNGNLCRNCSSPVGWSGGNCSHVCWAGRHSFLLVCKAVRNCSPPPFVGLAETVLYPFVGLTETFFACFFELAETVFACVGLVVTVIHSFVVLEETVFACLLGWQKLFLTSLLGWQKLSSPVLDSGRTHLCVSVGLAQNIS